MNSEFPQWMAYDMQFDTGMSTMTLTCAVRSISCVTSVTFTPSTTTWATTSEKNIKNLEMLQFILLVRSHFPE